MQSILLVVHVAISASLIALVLLQQGKGADAGAAFGSGASSTVFGARGSATFLSRVTAGLAAGFFVVSMSLAYLAGRTDRVDSIVDSVTEQAPTALVEEPLQSNTPADVPAAPAGAGSGQ